MKTGDNDDGDGNETPPRAHPSGNGIAPGPHVVVSDCDVICQQYEESVRALIGLARRTRKVARVLRIVGLDIGHPARRELAANAELTFRLIKIQTTSDFQIG